LLADDERRLRIFQVPVSGTYEVVSFLGAIVTAGALGYTRNGRTTSSWTSSRKKFRRKVKRALDRVSYALILVFFSVVPGRPSSTGRGSCGRASCPRR